MLHEVYTPQDVASIAWSRQKINALLRILIEIRNGTREPSVVLLYGPTGCGKLASANAMLRDQRDASGRSSVVEVMHSCEATPEQCYQFLMETLTDYPTVGGSLPTGGDPGLDRQWQVLHQNQSGTLARIIKFYGEPLNSRLYTLTLRFLDHYDALKRATSSNNHNGGERGEVGHASPLRRHLVLFILTTHDTHSDKVALGKALPLRILTHQSIEFFHCTPLTSRNMATRIKDILRMEMQGKKFPAEHYSISDEHMRLLCELSHGDIRHALLQVQWYLMKDTDIHAQTALSTDTVRKDEENEKDGRKRQVKQHKEKKVKNAISKLNTRAAKTVMDLVDEVDNDDCVALSLTASNNTGGRLGEVGVSVEKQKNAVFNGETGSAESSTDSTIFRDEYLDVAHATARILTQKYTMTSVTQELNVRPDKLLGYLVNNMPSYFSSDQIDEYASCAAAASFSDALRAAGSFSSWRGGDAGIHTTRFTGSDDNEGVGVIGLDLMSLILFGRTYVAFHKSVHIPRAFAPQRPPPFFLFAYPRLREVERPTRKRSRSVSNSYGGDETDQYGGMWALELFSSEAEWQKDFMRRLQLHMSSGNPLLAANVDIVRESLPSIINRCGSLDAVVLDYAPYARYIVLNHPPPAVARSPLPEKGTVLLSSGTAAPNKGISHSAGPKRTPFSFTRTEAPLSSKKRMCSLLQYNVLCLGLREKPSLRVESFTIGTLENDGDDNMAGVASDDFDSSRPWLPEGEDIEEYGD